MLEALIPLVIIIVVVALVIWVVENAIGPVPPPIKIGIMVIIGIFLIVYVARVLKIPGV